VLDNELIRELGRVQPMLLFLGKEVDYTEPQLVQNLRLNLSHIFALEIVVRKEPLTMGELADAMRAKASAMTRVVDGLVERGMVERIYTPADRRVVRLRPTENGKDVAGTIQKQRSEHLLALLKLLDDKNQRKLLEVLKAWQKAIGRK